MKNNYFNFTTGIIRWFFSLLILVGLWTTNANAASISSTTKGGLWNNTQTWVGGLVPTSADQVTIVDGAVVTMDVAATVARLTIGQGGSGVLQWNATGNALTVSGNILVNPNASFYPYTTTLASVTVNLSGNFTNNGTANCASSTFVFAGASPQSISGTGNFIGDGTAGMFRIFTISNPTSVSISTSQNLILASLNHYVGNLITNGKLILDNTAQIYGQPINQRVSNVVMTAMGTFTNEPVVFGAGVSPITVNVTNATLNSRYFNGQNVYLCTAAGLFTSPPTINPISNPSNFTTPFTTSGPTLLWIGTLGTLGTPYQTTALTPGTQYFYGNNLYTAVNGLIPGVNTPPTHTTTGTPAGPNNSFLYVGTVAKASLNYDVTATLNARSLNLTSAGSGYATAPSVSISTNGGTGSATATAVFYQSLAGSVNFTYTKGTVATISGGLTINSDQGAGAAHFSGVGGISIPATTTTGAGVGYTNAPKVGFALPINSLNLITSQGNGYITAPTISFSTSDTAGKIVNASINPTLPSLTPVVAGGKVVSIICTGTGTALWSSLPTFTISAPTGASPATATAAFPAGCLPTATALISSAGQITGFTITNAGFGYTAAPTVGLGTGLSGAPGSNAGTYLVVAATVPTARIALYNLTYSMNTAVPAVSNPAVTAGAEIPANNKMNSLTVGTGANVNTTTPGVNFANVTLSSNLELFGAANALLMPTATFAPMVLSPSILNLGGNSLVFSNPGYVGFAPPVPVAPAFIYRCYVTNGPITFTSAGGAATRSFPFDAPVVLTTTNANIPLQTGATATQYTITPQTAPTGTTALVNGNAIGKRSYLLTTNGTIGKPGAIAPLEASTLQLNWNPNDSLSDNQRLASLYIGQSTVNTGGWKVRSVSNIGGSDTAKVYQLSCNCNLPGNRTTAQPFYPGIIDIDSGGYFAFVSTANGTMTSNPLGGLWSDPATWAGGVVPTINDDAVIADGAVVTVDVVASVKSLTIGQGGAGTSILQWNPTANTMTVIGNVLVGTNGKLLPYTTAQALVQMRLGGNFTNNGTANLALTQLNFQGSILPGGSTSQILDGNGTFIGDGTRGLIRFIHFASTGSLTINTTQDLTTIAGIAAHSGTLNTNGKLKIDNTAQVYGQSLNLQIANATVTNMGLGYSIAPVVFGATVIRDTSAIGGIPGQAMAAGSYYYSGTNVYLCTVGGLFNTINPTATDTGRFTTSSSNGGTLLYVGQLGTIGQPYIITALTTGTQYQYNGNLYTAVNNLVPGFASPPIHTSGLGGPNNSFLYVGTAATVTNNYDAVNKRLRSLTIANAGVGYAAVPTISISFPTANTANPLTTAPTTAATAVAVYIQGSLFVGTGNSRFEGNATLTINGGLDINNDQGAPVATGNLLTTATGVGNISVANGGVNYTVAPLVGFSGPTALNLVTSGGSGYSGTTTPVITISGGTLVTGSPLTASNFRVVVAQGKLVSVYLNTVTTTYSVPPTISIAGTGTIAWPANCWPAATANIGSNRQLTSFTMTNAGYGYTVAPTIAVGTTTGTAAGGTFTTAATTLTARIGLYNVHYNHFNILLIALTEPTHLVAVAEGAEIPVNRKLNAMLMSNITGNTAVGGVNLSGNLELFGTSPLTLSSGIINLNTNTLDLTSYNNTVASGSFNSSVTNGFVSIASPGASTIAVTKTFPFNASPSVTIGLGANFTLGSTITKITVSQAASPTGSVSPSGSLVGKRSWRIEIPVGMDYGTNPSVTLSYNFLDSLVSDAAGLFVAQSPATTAGPWTVRSATSGTIHGTLGTTGSRPTGITTAPLIMVPTGNDYFTWVSTYTQVPLQFNIARTTGINYNSVISTGTAFTWISLPNNDEATSNAITIPSSTFTYCGQTINSFQIGTNGWAKLNSTTFPAISSWSNYNYRFAPSTNNGAQSNGNSQPMMLGCFYTDMISGGTGDLAEYTAKTRYKISTDPIGSRKITMEWFNFTPFGAAGAQASFQIVLDETDNSVSYNYGLFQAFNGIADVRFSYGVGMTGLQVSEPALPGQVLAQQYENSDVFSPDRTNIQARGAMSLMLAPDCNSSIKFTPGGGYTGGTIPVAAVPLNDEPANATIVTALSAFPDNLCGTFYSSRFATPSNSVPVCAGNNDDDVWFKFVAVDPNTIVRIYASGGYIPRVQLFDNSFNSISCKVGIIDAGTPANLNFPGSGVQLSTSLLAVPSSTYYVRVYHDRGGVKATATASINPNGTINNIIVNNTGSGYNTSQLASYTGPFTGRITLSGGGGSNAMATVNQTNGIVSSVTVNYPGSGYTSPPTVDIEAPNWAITGEFALVVFAKAVNDECATAIQLTNTENAACVTGQNRITGAVTTAASESPETSCNGTADDDVWYKFVGTGFNTVTVVGSGGFDPVFQVWDGGSAPGDCGAKGAIVCRNVTGASTLTTTTTETFSLSTTVGNTYYIRVYHAAVGAGGSTATHSVCVTSVGTTCILNPTLPLSGTSTCNGTGVTLSWAAAPAATGYDVYLRAGLVADSLVSSNQAGITFTTASALPPGNYSWQVVPRNNFGTATGCNTWSFSTINPLIVSTTNGVRCGTGTATLVATGSPGTTLKWYTTSTGGLPVGTGNIFTTPTINSTTTFYVSASLGSCESGRTAVVATVTAAPALTVTGSQTFCTVTTVPMSVTSAPGNFDTYIWSPFTNLYQDAAATIQYTGQNLTTVYVKVATGGTITYTCSGSEFATLCSNEATVSMTLQPNSGTISAAPASICTSGSALLTLTTPTAPTAGTIRWEVSLDNINFDSIPGAYATTYFTPVLNATRYYRVVITEVPGGANICTTTGSFTLIVNSPVALALSANQTVCNDAVATLSVTSSLIAYDTYIWSPTADLYTDNTGLIPYTGQNLSTVYARTTAAGTTIYSCTASNHAAPVTCESASTTSVTVLPSLIEVSGPDTVCYNTNALMSLTPSTGYGTGQIQWQSSATNGSFSDISGANSATYTAVGLTSRTYFRARIKDAVGGNLCVTTNVDSVEVNNPTVTNTVPDTSCGLGSVVLSATGSAGTTLNWYAASTGGSILATGTSYTTPVIGATKTYYVAATFSACTSTPRDSVIATITIPPALTLTAPQTICNNTIVGLSVTSNTSNYETYTWSPITNLYLDGTAIQAYNGEDTTSVFAVSSVAGTTNYIVTATNSSTQCVDTATTSLTVQPATAIISSVPVAICRTGSAVLTVTPGTGYGSGSIQWQDSPDNLIFTDIAGENGSTYTTPTLNDTMYYQVVVKNGAGIICFTASYSLNVNDPLVTFSAGGSRCGTGSTVLTATGSAGTTLNWYAALSGGPSLGTGSPFNTPSITGTSSFYVSASIGTCASTPRTEVVATVTNADPLTLSAPQTVCNGAIATLRVTSPSANYDTYLWSPADSLYLDAAATIAYAGQNTDTVYFKTSVAGINTITVNASNSAGALLCTNTTTTTVNNLPASATITASPAAICGGSGSAILSLNPLTNYTGGIIQWQDSPDNVNFTDISGANSNTYTTPTLNDTMYYQVIIKNGANGVCFTTASFELDVLNPLVVGSTPGSRCGNGTVVLSAIGTGSSLKWYAAASGGTALGTGASFTTPSIATTTTFYVSAALGICESDPRTIVVATVNPRPTLTVSTSTVVCNNGVTAVNVTSPALNFDTYLWSSTGNLFSDAAGTIPYAGQDTTQVFARNTVSGIYTHTITGTNSTGTQCGNSAFRIDTVLPASATISSNPATLCVSGSAQLGLTPTGTYGGGKIQWQESTDNSLFTDITGANDTIYNTPLITDTVYYKAKISATSGLCFTTSSYMMVVNNPQVDSVQAGSNCGPGIIVLNAYASSGTIKWYNAPSGGLLLTTGSSYTTPTLNNSTPYYVSLTLNGCEGSRIAVNANIILPPVLTVTAPQTICNGVITTLTVLTNPLNYTNYTWSPVANLYTDASATIPYTGVGFGQNLSTVYFQSSTPGAYSYKLDASNGGTGCASADSTVFSVQPASAVVSSSPAAICVSGSASLNLVPSGPFATGSIQWQQSANNSTFTDIPGAIGNTYLTIPQSTTRYYRAQIKNTGGVCYTTSPNYVMEVNNPIVLSTAPGTRCGRGTVVLGAVESIGATLNWYTVPFGGSVVGVGNSFTTPILSATTTYYVGANQGGCEGGRTAVVATVTPAPLLTLSAPQVVCSGAITAISVTSTLSNYDTYRWTPIDSLYLDAAATIPYTALDSASTVYFRSNVAGTRTFTVNSSNSASPQACVEDTTTTISVQPGEVTITNFPTAICVSGIAVLKLVPASPYGVGTIQWKDSPNNGVYTDIPGANANSYSTPVLSTTRYYQVEIKNGAGAVCLTTSTDTVSVNSPSVVSTAPNSRCGFGPVVLGAIGNPVSTLSWYADSIGGSVLGTGNSFTTPSILTTTPFYVEAGSVGSAFVPSVITFGASNILNTTTTWPSPYGNSNGSSHEQFMILATELSALNIAAGPISSVAFDLASTYTGTALQNYRIHMANTAATNMANFVSTGFTNVYNAPGSVTPVIGYNTYNFQTPFVWDGISNVIVDVQFSNCTVCNGSVSCATTQTVNGIVRQTVTPFVSSYSSHASNNCTINSFAPSGGTISTASQRPNMRLNATTTIPCVSGRTQVLASVTPPPALTVSAPQVVCNNAVATLSVVSNVSDFTTYLWSPTDSLYTDAAGTIPYTGQNLSTVYSRSSNPGTITYYIVSSDTVTTCANLDTTAVTVLPAAASVLASTGILCYSGTSTINLTPASPYGVGSIQWQVSNDNLVFNDTTGANGVSFVTPVLTSTKYYRVQIKNSAGTVCFSTVSDTVLVNNPQVLSHTDGSRCGIGSAVLNATSSPNTNLLWFSSTTGGVPLGTGPSFTTPVIAATTSYYVAAASTGSISNQDTATFGNASTAATSSYPNSYGNFYTNVRNQYLILASELTARGASAGNITSLAFNVVTPEGATNTVGTGPSLQNFTIKIGATGLTAMTTAFQSGLTQVFAVPNFHSNAGINTHVFDTPFLWDGVSNIIVETCHLNDNGLCPAVSTNYGSSATINRSITPFVSAISLNQDATCSVCNTATASVTTTSRPDMILNVSKSSGCISARDTVVAVVFPPPALTLDSARVACNNAITPLTVTSTLSDFDVYTWSPVTSLYQDAAATIAYTGQNLSTVYAKSGTAGTYIYTCTGTDTVSLCVNTSTDTLSVQPGAVTFSSNPVNICVSGSSVISIVNASLFAPGTIQWQQSSNDITFTDIAGETGATYTTPTLTSVKYYRITVKDELGALCFNSASYAMLVNNPQILTTTPDTICGVGQATLSATANAGSYLNWYSNAVGGSPLGTTTYFNIPVTGFNNDIVANGVGSNSILGTSFPLIGADGAQYTFIDNTYKYAAASALPTCFMPVSNSAASAQTPGLTYTFQSYTAPNALTIDNNSTTYLTSPFANSGTLTLAAPASYKTLKVLYESVVNVSPMTVDVVVTFTDASIQTFNSNPCVNWFTTTAPAFSGMGRTTPTGAIQCGVTPNMFELSLNLNPVNYTKQVQSITFTIPTVLSSGVNPFNVNYFHAMAVGGALPPVITNDFVTPFISVTDTFYVAANQGAGTSQISSNGVPNVSTSTQDGGVVFDLNVDVTLSSIQVYSIAAGTATVTVYNSSSTLLYTSPATPIVASTLAIPQTINLGVSLPAGTNYRILVNNTGNSLGYSSGAFPAPLGNGVGTITNGAFGIAGTTTLNYFVYNISTTTGCESARTPVVALVLPPPALSIGSDQTICSNDSVNLSVGAGLLDYNSFSWSPSTGLSSATNPSVMASPAATTTYILTANSSGAGLCVNKDTVVVTVNGRPVINTLTSVPSFVCKGDSTQLNLTASPFISPATGASNYSFAQSTTAYTPLVGGTVLGASPTFNDDINHPIVNIGFTFNYAGINYTSVGISDNCFIRMGVATTTSYSALTGLTNVICPMNADMLGNTATHELRYATTGVAPNRVFTVEWYNWAKYNFTADEFNIQLQLFETTGRIRFVYQPVTPANTFTVGVGINSNSVTDFNNRTTASDWSATTAGATNSATCSFSSSIFPDDGLTFTYSPPVPSNLVYAWTPVSGLSNATLSNPKASPAITTDYIATVFETGTGCSISDTVTVGISERPRPKVYPGADIICQGADFYQFVVDTGAYAGGYPPGTTVDWVGIVNGLTPYDSVFTAGITDFQVIVRLPAGLGGCNTISPNAKVLTHQLDIIPTISNVTCGNSNGKIIINVTGTAPYRYTWSDINGVLQTTQTSNTSDSITGLIGGTYYLEVIDNEGNVNPGLSCNSGQLSYFVPSNGGPAASIASLTNVTCAGANNGVATATQTGGTGIISYAWFPLGGFAATSDPLAPGSYYVQVSDANGCVDTAQLTITEPDLLVVVSSTVNATCGIPDGVAILNPAGGTLPYSYQWFDASFNDLFVNNDTLSGVPAGIYTGVVYDSLGCFAFIEDTINETCTTLLNLNAFIEGYYLGGGFMQSVLYNAEAAIGNTYPNFTDCDTITVELHDQLSPSVIVPDGIAQAILQVDGTAMVNYPGTIQGGSYWIVVKNRTMVETWSSQPVTFAGAITSYNFTTIDTMAYSNNMREIEPGYWVMYSGDIDDGSFTPFQDGFVDIFDYLIMDVDIQSGNAGYYVSDLNGDGFIDIFDFLVLDPNIQVGVSKLTPP